MSELLLHTVIERAYFEQFACREFVQSWYVKINAGSEQRFDNYQSAYDFMKKWHEGMSHCVVSLREDWDWE